MDDTQPTTSQTTELQEIRKTLDECQRKLRTMANTQWLRDTDAGRDLVDAAEPLEDTIVDLGVIVETYCNA